MGFLYAAIAVTVLVMIPWIGVGLGQATGLFGVFVPYLAIFIFFVGLVYRVVKWGQSPVPFRIPTTCGQAKSLPWVKTNRIDNPTSTWAVVVRMALEILLFRSLFRNTALDFRHGRATYSSSKWLWLFALAFHYTFLVVLIRHLRFFLQPVPWCIDTLAKLDAFLQIGLFPLAWMPELYQSGVILLGAATVLLLRRILVPSVRYISLTNDWFPLLLVIAIAKTGVIMRYLLKTDVVAVKQLTLGLVHFQPVVPDGVGAIFFIHIFLVSVLFAYFPFSKLMHAPGVFMSPTRNMVNNSREVRHINPWNPKVKFHDYHEYEDDFREYMIEAGLPVEKEISESEGAEHGAPEA
ncbi:MAG: sulfate reduction electron transfer complex DsrMKJOP subunit DsrM [Proteobacteria bacterium]|nr:sulfate reduction electron transfer complex DsrMKJOP subunit DsrM [Pseudomonadota bacterium]